MITLNVFIYPEDDITRIENDIDPITPMDQCEYLECTFYQIAYVRRYDDNFAEVGSNGESFVVAHSMEEVNMKIQLDGALYLN
ncbi:hypothetical protein Phi18:3_gp081 [Cellulophaga phage phi18:3]|uniref:Uncharacterized protein n=1 Tax=Cellulophaga phage phi18:3 TaxID=1327983 RepID=S0A347_9CAUD|nr:hypothetical protein Phi18:3_gp081 [Cellulophaga phage phi18:3]AGO48593.1 hypothetical protein Phi18:3_gp081 [Cellulophaga phage phi18:3]